MFRPAERYYHEGNRDKYFLIREKRKRREGWADTQSLYTPSTVQSLIHRPLGHSHAYTVREIHDNHKTSSTLACGPPPLEPWHAYTIPDVRNSDEILSTPLPLAAKRSHSPHIFHLAMLALLSLLDKSSRMRSQRSQCLASVTESVSPKPQNRKPLVSHMTRARNKRHCRSNNTIPTNGVWRMGLTARVRVVRDVVAAKYRPGFWPRGTSFLCDCEVWRDGGGEIESGIWTRGGK